MKLALGLLVWFVNEHIVLSLGLVVFVAVAVAVGTFFPKAP